MSMELCKERAIRAITALGEKLSGVNVTAAKTKLPKPDDVRRAALAVWAKLVGLYAAVCACFRRPGLSEAAAVTAFGVSVVGSIVAVFQKKMRRLMPLFGVLAALGTAIVVLRCIFPRRED